jgi:hypothetical protein
MRIRKHIGSLSLLALCCFSLSACADKLYYGSELAPGSSASNGQGGSDGQSGSNGQNGQDAGQAVAGPVFSRHGLAGLRVTRRPPRQGRDI